MNPLFRGGKMPGRSQDHYQLLKKKLHQDRMPVEQPVYMPHHQASEVILFLIRITPGAMQRLRCANPGYIDR